MQTTAVRQIRGFAESLQKIRKKGVNMMEYTHLGRTGLLVSRLCLGTMAFGNSTDEKESFRIMDEALDLGINFFDSANNYGKATNNEGITEKIIGKWFA